MLRASVVETVCEPETPVIVSVFVPRAAALLAVRISVDDCVIRLGEKEAVTPLGKPEIDSFTPLENPYWGLIETYEEYEVLWPMFTTPGP